MSFAENLKQLRKEKQMSQEDLAELLNVSRQSVSKWEQGLSYPEVETLLLLSKTLSVSLDEMLSTGFSCTETPKTSITGSLIITSPNENVIATCSKVQSSQRMSRRKNKPNYALYGFTHGGSQFFGEPATFLGWYANEELISKEMEAIHNAISNGIPTYTLQYSAQVQRRWSGLKLVSK